MVTERKLRESVGAEKCLQKKSTHYSNKNFLLSLFVSGSQTHYHPSVSSIDEISGTSSVRVLDTDYKWQNTGLRTLFHQTNVDYSVAVVMSPVDSGGTPRTDSNAYCQCL